MIYYQALKIPTKICLALTDKPIAGINLVPVTERKVMKDISRPGTILAMAGTALILAGIVTMPHYEFGLYVMYAGFLLAGLFWVWTVMDVIGARNLRSFQKMFWLVVTILIPVMGGLMFYVMNHESNKLIS